MQQEAQLKHMYDSFVYTEENYLIMLSELGDYWRGAAVQMEEPDIYVGVDTDEDPWIVTARLHCLGVNPVDVYNMEELQ